MSMENAGTAFALVIAAGAATGIGAAVVFFPTLAKLANRRFLGCSLGLAAGVMLYVSLVDIYGKAITGFMESGHDEGKAFLYTTICFFGGILLMMVRIVQKRKAKRRTIALKKYSFLMT
jgi:zinc transporter, ZIP family